MPALNFAQQFAADVESGKKRQSIRARRKRAWQVGDTLHLFVGQRLGSCCRLGRATLLSVQQIQIDGAKREVQLEKQTGADSYMAPLFDDEVLELARADGFDSLDDFFKFFPGRISGHLLKW
jgi:uncharacterized protein YqfB (UPF0267 family)